MKSAWEPPDYPDTNSGGADTTVTYDRLAPPPSIFKVEMADDNQHLKFTVGHNYPSSKNRTTIVEFRVYFTPTTMLPSGASPQSLTQAQAQQMFSAGTLVDSKPAPGKNPVVTFLNRQYVGSDGVFFACSVNRAHVQSAPTSGIYNPSIALNVNAGTIPADVTEPQVTWESLIVNNRTVVAITVDAKPPVDTAFDGYQIYLVNYKDTNAIGFVDSTQMTYEEGPFFKNPSSPSTDGTLSGTFTLAHDAPSVYDVGAVDVAYGDPVVHASSPSTTNWSPTWGLSRRIVVMDNGDPANNYTATGEYLHDYPISVVNTDGTLQIMSPPTWVTSKSAQYAIYPYPTGSDTGNISKPHRVRLYFVSISKVGTRRSDPLNSPFVDLPWGFTSSLGDPINPTSLTYTATGTTINLRWGVIDPTGADGTPTISHFNINRQRAGTYGALAPAYRPTAPYTTVKCDSALAAGGLYTFTDRNFDADPTSATYDFNPVAPGVYWYYVTSVNVEGRENPLAWAFIADQSTLDGTHKTLTHSSGDLFQYCWAGQNIILWGPTVSYTYEISAVTSQTSLTITETGGGSPDPLQFDATGYVWTIGSALITLALIGNSGGEDDPSIYRDDMYNRLYNADFNNQAHATTSSPVPLVVASGGPYGPALELTDGQIVFMNYNPNYATSKDRERNYAFAQATPLIFEGKALDPGNPFTTDDFTVWEYYKSTNGVVPAFQMSTTSTGSIILDCGTPSPNYEESAITQFTRREKFLVGESLILSCLAVQTTDWGSLNPPGTLELGVSLVSMHSTPNYTYKHRYLMSNFFPCTSILVSDVTPFVLSITLPSSYTYGVSNATTYTCVDGSTTITWHSGDDIGAQPFLVDLNGIIITINTIDYAIDTFNPFTHTITLLNPFSKTADPAGTDGVKSVVCDVDWDTFQTYISLFGLPNLSSSTPIGTVSVTKPMLIGGKLPVKWTPIMSPSDAPGLGKAPAHIYPRNFCVVGNTTISTPNGFLQAGHVDEGQDVLSWQSGLVRNKVEKVFKNLTRTLYTIHLEGGAMLRCTESHPVAMAGKKRITYKRAEEVRVGDRIVVISSMGRTEGRVDAVERAELATPVWVYNFRMAHPPYNYITNGILSHNKGTFIEPIT